MLNSFLACGCVALCPSVCVQQVESSKVYMNCLHALTDGLQTIVLMKKGETLDVISRDI